MKEAQIISKVPTHEERYTDEQMRADVCSLKGVGNELVTSMVWMKARSARSQELTLAERIPLPRKTAEGRGGKWCLVGVLIHSWNLVLFFTVITVIHGIIWEVEKIWVWKIFGR